MFFAHDAVACYKVASNLESFHARPFYAVASLLLRSL